MRIGIVSLWFNRGQGAVGRLLRSILDGLGHETFVLARPTQQQFARPGFVDDSDVWNQPNVTRASAYLIPTEEYLLWAQRHSIDVALFDQNYQFEEIARLRSLGIRTIGRFVWESFSAAHVAGALSAFDVVYSLTRCEQRRYAAMGVESLLMPWGCHPELLEVRVDRRKDVVRFFYPGGYMSKRKPTATVIEAFRNATSTSIELIIKTQETPRGVDLEQQLAAGDSRIRLIAIDLPTEEYLRLFASCHVCLAPSRWEGLGLHLYEATAFGMPIITNDNPPMNEIVRHDDNGLLVRSKKIGTAASGIDSFEPDCADLARAIETIADPEVLSRLTQGALRRRDELSWEKTTAAFDRLITSVRASSIEAAR